MKTIEDFLIPMPDAIRIHQTRPDTGGKVSDEFSAAARRRISWAVWALDAHNRECQRLADMYAYNLTKEFQKLDREEAKKIYSPLTGKGTLLAEQTQLLNPQLREARWLNAIFKADPLFRHLMPTTPPPPSKALCRKYTHPAP